MVLRDILYKVAVRTIAGNTSTEVSDIHIDSRKVKPGTLFIAVKGVAADGHQFIEKALENGAAVIVSETIPASLKEGVVYVQVEDSAAATGRKRSDTDMNEQVRRGVDEAACYAERHGRPGRSGIRL